MNRTPQTHRGRFAGALSVLAASMLASSGMVRPVAAAELEGTLDLSVGAMVSGEEGRGTPGPRTDLELLLEAADEQGLHLQYQRLPSDGAGTGLTPLRREGNRYRLPGGWQSNDNTTSGMSGLSERLESVDLWQERRTLKLDYWRTLAPEWTLTADFRRDQVDGIQPLGGATGATGGNVRAILFAAPIDRETHTAQLGLSHTGTRSRWQLSYLGSFFDNGYQSLSWPTPFGPHPQWGPGTAYPEGRNQLAREPDNQAHQVRGSGHWTLTSETRLMLDAAFGRHSQDQAFLPYTVNGDLVAPEPLPSGSLDGQVDTTRVKLRMTHRPNQKVHLIGHLGYRERDNTTPIHAYQRIRGDAANQVEPLAARLNRPYSRTHQEASLEWQYRQSRGLQWYGGLSRDELERDYSEVAESREQGVNVGVRSTSSESWAVALDYHRLERRAERYIGNQPLLDTYLPGAIDADDFENHPLLRKYYLADRDRDQWRLRTDWYPHPRVSVGLLLADHRDDYPSGYFGLSASDMISTNLDVTWTPSDRMRLSGFVGRERYLSDQSGRSFRGNVPTDVDDPARNWALEARDEHTSAGVNLDWTGLQPRWGDWRASGVLDLSVHLSRSLSEGRYRPTVGEGLLGAPLPEVRTRYARGEVSARYHWAERHSVRLALEREHYRDNDFAARDIAPDTLANVLLMGAGTPAYSATWVTLGYRHQF